MKFKDSALAHQLLDNLQGIEIGAAAHNPFNLNTLNVDYTDDPDTTFRQGEFKLCGEHAKVDVVAPGDDLPFPDETWDFVISSHVIEHFFDPIRALMEWYRVIKPGGYIYTICPKERALPGEDRPVTTTKELFARHYGPMTPDQVDMGGYQTSSVTGLPLNEHGHWTVFSLDSFVDLCYTLELPITHKQPSDDKVGNGFCVVIQKKLQGE